MHPAFYLLCLGPVWRQSDLINQFQCQLDIFIFIYCPYNHILSILKIIKIQLLKCLVLQELWIPVYLKSLISKRESWKIILLPYRIIRTTSVKDWTQTRPSQEWDVLLSAVTLICSSRCFPELRPNVISECFGGEISTCTFYNQILLSTD